MGTCEICGKEFEGDCPTGKISSNLGIPEISFQTLCPQCFEKGKDDPECVDVDVFQCEVCGKELAILTSHLEQAYEIIKKNCPTKEEYIYLCGDCKDNDSLPRPKNSLAVVIDSSINLFDNITLKKVYH